MDLDEYQKLAARTAVYGTEDKKYIMMYLSMGLAGESGEVIEKLKKVVRNDGGVVSEDKLESIKKEMGDVLWYLSQLAGAVGLTFNQVAEANITKLADRADRGVLKSEGDAR